ncbi:MAG: exosortase-associated EpsI family protein [Dehalococcoidia bacterium]
MSFFRRYSAVIGGLILALVIIVLVSVPSNILARQATFIGTELQYASGNEIQVRTKMDFGDIEHMQEFPKKFGDWLGLDFESSEMAESLGADFLILRKYLNTHYYQPIDFIIMQSKERSSFHAPPICYRALGWEVEEEGVEEVSVSDVTWASASPPISLDAKKLVAFKESNGEVEEREVALYFYVKGRLFEDTVTMVEVAAPAPVEGSYDEALRELKDFMGETVPYMFEPAEQEGEMLAIYLGRSWGGRGLMAILVLIPLAIIIYPMLRRGRKQNKIRVRRAGSVKGRGPGS